MKQYRAYSRVNLQFLKYIEMLYSQSTAQNSSGIYTVDLPILGATYELGKKLLNLITLGDGVREYNTRVSLSLSLSLSKT